MAPQIEASPFTPQVIRGLSDKLYEKRKAAALDVERLIRDSLLASDHGRVSLILTALIDDFAYSSLPNARNGGLIALAAAAIALGTAELCRHLDAIVPPILSCFTDQDSRVRYYACESMYNVAKVARGDILKYFNEVFDALSKLSSDAEPSVKNGAELLDRLMKDIVSERAIFWAPDQKDAGPESDQTGNELSAELSPIPTVSTYPAVPGTVPLRPGMKPTQFNLPRFIPLLAERIHTLAPFTRTFLVQWISVLDSVPDLELIAFLPDFLDGLFNYLSDPNIDVRVATLNVLGEFLKEIRDVLVTQRERGVLRIRGKTSKPPARHRRDGSDVSVSFANLSVESNQRPPEQVSLELPSEIPPSLQPDHPIALSSDELQPPHTSTRREGEPPNRTDSNNNESLPYIPGLGVVLDIGRMTEILIPHLMSTDEETQATSLRWINEFIILAREVILPFTPMLLNAILPSLAHSVASIKSVASETNSSLYKLILDLPTTAIAPRDGPGESGAVTTVSLPSGGYDLAAHTPAHLDNIDLDASVETLTLQFQDEREDTRVAALEWLLMLHKKAPMEVLCSDDPTFQALLRTLSDSSEEVVKRDLQLLAQVSQHSDDEYFTRFMVNLLSLFSTDRRLLETRGSLIIRQLCLSLNPERMYRTFAEIIEREEDLEFASTMVQNLNFILITAPELSELRRRLKNLDSRDGILLFTALYRSWCHNAVAVFSLCLLAQAYEHASNLLTLFADLEITVNLLIQIDKLVQLLESPVFTYLRLQLLEPDRYPHLFKCLYGILMLLPQSSAFATLRNRLNSVSSMVFMFSGGGAGGALLMNVSTSSGSSQTEPQTRNGFSALGLRRSKPPGISPGPSPTTSPESTPPPQMRWNDLLQQFRHVQARHERSRRIGGA
ncbi:vacuolar protein 14 C-terminal Fig4p binding-domain-containing protein [Powellomyces hirtus]|nr:vacuolar protein 14 C-terminal Fig4p binding-domain-containing protein [Powellomyces hirtus]